MYVCFGRWLLLLLFGLLIGLLFLLFLVPCLGVGISPGSSVSAGLLDVVGDKPRLCAT